MAIQYFFLIVGHTYWRVGKNGSIFALALKELCV